MAKYEQLVEIKKGKTGNGLLIENDGYISRDLSENNKRICESLEGSEWHVPNPFIVDAVLQKYDTKNANGRVYPEAILKREVAKYQELIADNRAMGECYTPDAMCLTADGWKSIVDIKEGDEICTLDADTQSTSIQKVTYKTENDWDGIMYHISSDEIDDIVTPNHGFPIFKWVANGKYEFDKFMTAEELSKTEKGSGLYIPLSQSLTKFYDISQATYSEESYNGKVYCVEVPNHVWFVKQNGKCHWTKNCNHPESSNIDLSRVSHKIIECHWEGKTLVGKLELLVSEAFRRNGTVCTCGDQVALLLMSNFKIGISSRAVGSVEEKFGQMIVGEDLDLICLDIVCTPSTPGAYLSTKGTDLQQYVETDISKFSKPKLNEQSNKVDRILNILSE